MSRRPPRMIGPRPATRPVRRVVKKTGEKPEEKKDLKQEEKKAAAKPEEPKAVNAQPKASAEPAKESPASKPAAEPAKESPASKSAAAPVKESPASKPEAESKKPGSSAGSSKTKNRPAAKADKTEKKSKSSSTSRVIVVLLILLLLGGNGFLIFEKFNTEETLATVTADAKEAKIEYASDIERKVAEISMLQDSIRKVIAEKEVLGLALTEEKARVAELEKLKGQVRSKQVSINSLNSKLSRYKKENEKVKQNVGHLLAENQRLVTLKREMEEEMKAKEDSLKALAEVQVKLAQKVSKAAALTAENIAVSVFNTGGKEMKNPRAMMAGKVKASMNLGKNDIAELGEKDVYLRVVEPSGNTLSMGTNSFTGVDGKKVYYSLKQTIDFDNSGQKVTFIYNKGSRYLPGRYTIEFYADGRKIGDSQFTLRK